MFKTILAATDGSDHASRAVTLASDLAKKYDARLILVSTVDDRELTPTEQHLAEVEFGELLRKRLPYVQFEDMPGAGLKGVRPLISETAGVTTRIRETLADAILEKAKRTAERKGVASVETRMKSGDAASVILATAKDCQADLIVIGSRGLSDLRGLMLGSVSHKVANLAEATVITVK